MRSVAALLLVCVVGLLCGCASPYPKSTEGLAEFHRVYEPRPGVAFGDDVYYEMRNIVPLKIEALPFGYCPQGIGYDDPRYYRVEGTQDWIYEYWRTTRSGAILATLYRAGAEIPLPERAAQLCVTADVFPPLGGEAKVLLTFDDPALIQSAAQTLQGSGVQRDTLRLRLVGSLQFRSPEYPGVAVRYSLQRDSQGRYYLLTTDLSVIPPLFLACPLDENLNQALHEGLRR